LVEFPYIFTNRWYLVTSVCWHWSRRSTWRGLISAGWEEAQASRHQPQQEGGPARTRVGLCWHGSGRTWRGLTIAAWEEAQASRHQPQQEGGPARTHTGLCWHGSWRTWRGLTSAGWEEAQASRHQPQQEGGPGRMREGALGHWGRAWRGRCSQCGHRTRAGAAGEVGAAGRVGDMNEWLLCSERASARAS